MENKRNTQPATMEAVRAAYDAGDSIETMLEKFGRDDDALRTISFQCGVTMSTLRRRAAR